eukprot:2795655-Pyramimonas_sp.AAC.1
MLRAILWTLRATMWTLRATMWTLRAVMWTLRAMLWMLRARAHLEESGEAHVRVRQHRRAHRPEAALRPQDQRRGVVSTTGSMRAPP